MTEFFVSPTGDDTHSGRSADSTGAFRTLARAQQAMRANPGGDTAVLRGGTYTLDAPLSLTAADAGSTFTAYAGETPVLSGGVAVKGWMAKANGVWTAKVNVADMRQLTINGVAQTEARYPNYNPGDSIRGGWLWAKPLPAGHNPLREMAYDTTKLGAAQFASGQRVTVFTDNGYASDSLLISSVDTKAGIVKFASDATYNLGSASRFVLTGGKPQLDQPGEWWFDKASRTLSYKAPAGFNGSGAVAAGGNKTLVQIDRTSGITLRGLTFSDTATTAQNDDVTTTAVVVRESSNIAISGNRFANVAKGVFLDDDTHHATVSGNTFKAIASTAVDLGPGTHENTITNNDISRVGAVFRGASGIALTESWGNTVGHNRIQDVPRFGISETNYTSTNKSGANTYEYNEINRSGQETPDTGAIYIYSGDDPTHLGATIHYNKIVDTGGTNTTVGAFVPGKDFSWGIYLDDYTNNAKVYGNFVSGTVLGGVNVHGGVNTEISNNVLLDNQTFGISFQEIDRAMTGSKVHHNFVEVPRDGTVVAADPAFINPSSFYDNVYYNTSGEPIAFDDYRTLAQWQALEGDPRSDVVSNTSGMVNTTAGDYRFRPDAFALTQGITQLPFDQVGTMGALPSASGAALVLASATSLQTPKIATARLSLSPMLFQASADTPNGSAVTAPPQKGSFVPSLTAPEMRAQLARAALDAAAPYPWQGPRGSPPATLASFDTRATAVPDIHLLS